MLFSFICPTAFIENPEIGGQSDFLLALSHLIELKGEPNDYTKALVNSQKPIYLDNGLFENGEPEGIDVLIDKISYLQTLGCEVKYVFSPDILYSFVDTLDRFEEFRSRYTGITKIVPVVQGSSIADFRHMIDILTTDGVSMISLSYMACVKIFEGETGTSDVAVNRMRALSELQLLGYKGSVHLLGLGSSLHDVKFANYMKGLGFFKEITHDSSSAFMLGINKRGYDKSGIIVGGKVKGKVDFDLDTITLKQLGQIIDNISFIKKNVG